MKDPTLKPNLIICFSTLICLICFGVYYKLDRSPSGLIEQNEEAFIRKRFGNFLVKNSEDQRLLKKDQAPLGVQKIDTKEISDLIKEIYQARQTAYISAKSNLVMKLDMMFVIAVIGLFVLFYQPREVEVPLIKFNLPDKLFYLIVPLGIVYLFFQLGFTLNAALDSRVVLEIMTDTKETIGEQRINYYFSNSRTLVDQGFIDSWCNTYYGVFDAGSMKKMSKFNSTGILYLWFGTFFGLMQGICHNLISVYYIKYKNKYFTFFLSFATIGGYAMWSLSMIAWYQHCALLIAWQWGAAIITILLWNKFGAGLAARLQEKKE